MSDFMYNILWIDDEHETLGGTKGRAKRNGINLVPFKSLNGGMGELSRNYPNYDGVLLDAKFFENEDDVKGSEDTYNVHRAKEELFQLRKRFEIFILTGQSEAYDDTTFQKAFKRVYKKGSDSDIQRLLNDIKDAANGQRDTQIRHEYRRAFEVCSEKYIGEASGIDLLSLLKEEEEIGSEKYFNTIRKILEDLFLAFHKFNLLPSEFVNPQVSLNQSSIFLSGQDQNERTNARFKLHRHLEETHLSRTVSNTIRSLLHIVQPGSHRSGVDKHVHLVNNSYLLKSLTFQLLDVLVWFKIYIDSNPKKHNWERTVSDSTGEIVENPLIDGRVINCHEFKGFAFLEPDNGDKNEFIPPHLVERFQLKDGDNVRGEIQVYHDNTTGERRTRVSNITKLKNQ